MMNKQAHKSRSGQAILFLFFVMLIAMFVVLWNFDLHRGVVTKMRMRDAGDAAALAAARWQGISLNMIGELNLVQAALVTEHIGDAEALMDEQDSTNITYYAIEEALRELIGDELDALNDLRKRIAYMGPLVAYSAAQQMALNNGIHRSPRFTRNLQDRVDNSWGSTNTFADEYLYFADAIADNGIAARTIMTRDAHILLDPGFYQAIEAGYFENYWCSFVYHADYEAALRNYDSTDYWPPLPDNGGYTILDLDLRSSSSTIAELAQFGASTDDGTSREAEFGSVMDRLGTEYNQDIDLDAVTDVILDWTVYGSGWRASWQDFIDNAYTNPLPFRSAVLPQYDYMGPEAIFDVQVRYDEVSPLRDGQIMRWVAAAKAFGYLDYDGARDKRTPNYFDLVLPAFEDARLIPVQRRVIDASVNPDHDYWHLMNYIQQGVSWLDADSDGICDNGCPYCQDLLYFDDPAFRTRGMAWLDDPDNVDYCEKSRPIGIGGGGGSGGAPYGH